MKFALIFYVFVKTNFLIRAVKHEISDNFTNKKTRYKKIQLQLMISPTCIAMTRPKYGIVPLDYPDLQSKHNSFTQKK